MNRPNTTGTKSSTGRGPLLELVISSGEPPSRSTTTTLTNPARTRAHSVLPTIHEEATPSPLSTICRPSPVSPRAYSILNKPARARSPLSIQDTHSSSPSSVSQSHFPPRITILSDLEWEKREAHPRSTPNPKSILLNAAGSRSLSSVRGIHSPSTSVSRPRSPLHITTFSDPENEKSEAHPQSPKGILFNPARTRSLPSVSRSRSPSHITILSNPGREKREAHPLSPPKPKSILLNPARIPSIQGIHSSYPSSAPSPPHITIISDLKKEKREAHPRSTKKTKSIRNVLAAALAPKRVSIMPISILKAPTPPAPAPAPTVDPSPDAVKEKPSDIVVQETKEGVRDPETSTCADATLTSNGEMLRVPLVDWRGGLDEDEPVRYYPKEYAKGLFVNTLRSMVRSGNRSAAARRRDHTRRRSLRRTAATATATTTPPSIVIHPPA